MENDFNSFKEFFETKLLPTMQQQLSKELEEKITNIPKYIKADFKNMDDFNFQALVMSTSDNVLFYNAMNSCFKLIEIYHEWLLENYDINPKK